MATSTGYYLYGITDCRDLRKSPGNSVAEGGEVQNIPYRGIGILCSPINGKKLKPNRDNLISHQKILEAWLKSYTILPMRFGMVAQSKSALHHGIQTNLPLIRAKLQQLKGKRELNIKAFWEKEFIYEHILEKYPVVRGFRDRISQMKGPGKHHKSIELGQWVERALVAEGEKEAKTVIEEILPSAFQVKKNKVFGELMFLNLAVLVSEKTELELDRLVNQAAEKRKRKVKFMYIGPSAPASFIDIHLKF